MRLSWYGDTGVAVLSIWQGGRCSGTFRLPVDELPRMVDTLQRGPDADQSGRDQPGRPQGDYDALDVPRAPDYDYGSGDYGSQDDHSSQDVYSSPDVYSSVDDDYRSRPSGSHAIEVPPAAPGYVSSPPEIHPSDPLGLGYRASGDGPDYLAAPSRDYRAADRPPDRPDYPADQIRDYPARDRRDYPAGNAPEFPREASAAAHEDLASEPYPSWPGPDSGAHSRPRGWPEDYPGDEALPHGHRPSGSSQDRRLADDPAHAAEFDDGAPASPWGSRREPIARHAR